MKRSSVWPGLLILALPASPAAFASPPEVELRIVLQVQTGDAARGGATAEVHREVLDQTLQTIRNRLHELGIDDPVVEAAPGDRISIRLPAVEDPERAIHLIRSTGLLECRFVRFPAGGGGAGSREAILQSYGGQLPANLEILEGDVREASGVTGTQYYAVERRPVVTGRDFKSARPSLSQFGTPRVEFQLQPEAAEAFGEATGQNAGSGLAIVLDGQVVSAPRINSRIGGGRGEIEGRFTEAEAQDFVTLLRSGPLPARVTVIQEEIRASPANLRRMGLVRLTGLSALLLFLVALIFYTRRRRQRPATSAAV
ncbi:MAG TPA: hypothetical protein VIA62_04780 [Thermoanaerobaculia bacterium]|jgi:preprotein translocase subunit SecD|nr:hypothetical protein [Thermoanaerobaculia bacterium]